MTRATPSAKDRLRMLRFRARHQIGQGYGPNAVPVKAVAARLGVSQWHLSRILAGSLSPVTEPKYGGGRWESERAFLTDLEQAVRDVRYG